MSDFLEFNKSLEKISALFQARDPEFFVQMKKHKNGVFLTQKDIVGGLFYLPFSTDFLKTFLEDIKDNPKEYIPSIPLSLLLHPHITPDQRDLLCEECRNLPDTDDANRDFIKFLEKENYAGRDISPFMSWTFSEERFVEELVVNALLKKNMLSGLLSKNWSQKSLLVMLDKILAVQYKMFQNEPQQEFIGLLLQRIHPPQESFSYFQKRIIEKGVLAWTDHEKSLSEKDQQKILFLHCHVAAFSQKFPPLDINFLGLSTQEIEQVFRQGVIKPYQSEFRQLFLKIPTNQWEEPAAHVLNDVLKNPTYDVFTPAIPILFTSCSKKTRLKIFQNFIKNIDIFDKRHIKNLARDFSSDECHTFLPPAHHAQWWKEFIIKQTQKNLKKELAHSGTVAQNKKKKM